MERIDTDRPTDRAAAPAGDATKNDPLKDAAFSDGAKFPRIELGIPRAAEEVSRRLLVSDRSYTVAIAQITTDPGCVKENTAKIVDYISEARARGARMVVFPELAIPGYSSLDSFYNKNYIAENMKSLDLIKAASHGITVVVGFAHSEPASVRPGGRPSLYNSAAVIRDGEIVHIQDKELLPNYNIFFEDRYFEQARERKVVTVDGIRIGTEICEDLWSEGYRTNPTKELGDKGADLITNLSASPFHLGKMPVRLDLISEAAKKNHSPFIDANLVGSFDGYEGEVVFDGRSIVMGADGHLKGVGKAFKEELLIVDVYGPQELDIPVMKEVEELYEALKLGISDYFRRVGRTANFQKAIIGISGGIDSAVVAALAVEALGPDKVMGITMPSKYSTGETISDAEILARNLGIALKTVPIREQVQASLETFRADPDILGLPENVAEENVQARLRMLNLMYYANKMGGLVLNTGNKTELALDNCTIYGDMVGGFSVLGDVDKDRVYDLARYINQRAGREVIPATTITRPPAAELKPGQVDADVMGGDPEKIAPDIRKIVENGFTYQEAVEQFGQKYSPELLRQWYQRLDRSEWKRRQSSPAIRVTPLAFGNGRRVPMGHGFIE